MDNAPKLSTLTAQLPASAKVDATPGGIVIERDDGVRFYGAPREALANFLQLGDAA